MRFSKEFKPELCVSEDPRRALIGHVLYDHSQKRLVSTDGHMLAFVPCVPEDEDPTHPILLGTEAIKASRKASAKKDPHVVVHANGEAVAIPGGPVYPHPKIDKPSAFEAARDYPEVDRVVPKMKPDDEGTVTVALNPELLLRLATALGASEGVEVTIKIDDTKGPMMVNPIIENGATGVLMPRGRKKRDAP